MERKEFLNLVGISVGAVILQNCLSGCTKAYDPTPAATIPTITPPTTGGGSTTTVGFTGNNDLSKGAINFTVDINSSTFSDLKNNGKAVVSGDVIIARTKTGDFLALEKACTHAQTTVDYNAEENNFVCNNHGSVFDANGSVTKSPASKSLKKYTTVFDSTKNTLKIS